MWERLRHRILGGRAQGGEILGGLPVAELASFIYFSASQEALQLVKELGLEQTEANERLPRILVELFAFYQYLVLVYAANVTGLDTTSLNLFGGSLNLALAARIPSEPTAFPKELLFSDDFHDLIAAYLSGDTSVSGLAPDDWTRLLRFTSFDKLSGDFMAMNHLVLFSRLLRALGTSYGEASGAKLPILTWMTHRNFAKRQEVLLREKFERAFPGRLA